MLSADAQALRRTGRSRNAGRCELSRFLCARLDARRRERASSSRATFAAGRDCGSRPLARLPVAAACRVPRALARLRCGARARRGVGRVLARPASVRTRGGSPAHAMRLADQLLDRGDRLAVGRRHDGDRGAGLAGAAGAADAVDVVVGVMRHVEIEDVADVRNVEAARGDVGGDQQLDLAACGTDRAPRCAPTGPCRRAARRR